MIKLLNAEPAAKITLDLARVAAMMPLGNGATRVLDGCFPAAPICKSVHLEANWLIIVYSEPRSIASDIQV